MNKCFITKLPSSVDNDNLPVLGQLKINWLKQDALSDNSQRGLWLSTNDSITVKVSGAHFTDKTLTSNLGNTKTITAADGRVALYVSNDADAILTIDNKYSLTVLETTPNFETSKLSSISFDIDDIRYCTNLISLVLQSPQVIGDISAVSNLTNIKVLGLVNTQVSGNIDSLASITKLTDFGGLQGTSLIGDMSKIPAGVNFISQLNRKVTTNFTWTANGRKNATLLAIDGNVPFDTASMDNMFIDQATCTFKGNDGQPWTKAISVSGTRTSASDAAVETIQNMGVTITGVTKQA